MPERDFTPGYVPEGVTDIPEDMKDQYLVVLHIYEPSGKEHFVRSAVHETNWDRPHFEAALRGLKLKMMGKIAK